MSWDVFISHASEDKDEVARPLAAELQKRGVRVWFDESELLAGDSLRRSIDHGLIHTSFGVIILSPAFFSKEWPQRELDALISQETLVGKPVLPVWHNLSPVDVINISPMLADKIGVSTRLGLEHVADELVRAMHGGAAPHDDVAQSHIHGERLRLVDVSVDEEHCFFRLSQSGETQDVRPTPSYNPYSTGLGNIYPILDVKLNNFGATSAFVYRITTEILDCSDLHWKEEYFYPCGIVAASACYDVRLDPTSKDKTLVHNVSLKVAPHDVERFQVAFASVRPAEYTIRLTIHYDANRHIDAGVFRLTIPGAYLNPHKILRATIDEALHALRDKSDEYSRVQAASLLGRAGYERARSYLLQTLVDECPSVRVAAARALGACGNPETAMALVKVLQSDAEDRVREAAASALIDLEYPEVVPAVLDCLADRSVDVRRTICYALGKLGSMAAGERLLQVAQHDASDLVRDSAIDALGVLRYQGAFPVLCQLAEKAGRRSQAVVKALRRLRDPQSLNFFRDLLHSDDFWERREAAEALGELGLDVATEDLRRSLRDDPEYGVVRAAAISLALLGDLRYLPEAIGQDPWWEKEVIVRELAQVGERAIPVLAEICAFHEDSAVRVASASALGQLHNPWGSKLLEAELRRTSEGIQAAVALVKLGHETGAQFLVAIVEDNADENLSLEAAIALAGLGTGVGYGELITALQTTPMHNKARDITNALAIIGNPKAIPVLQAAWDAFDGNGATRMAIEVAIERLWDRVPK